ncbi:hypothetical protein GCM10017744_089480 [Streptomyces antimycoticus]
MEAYGPASPGFSAVSMASKSARDGHGGFSHHTQAPAFSAVTAWSRCTAGGVHNTTRSGRSSVRVASRSVEAYGIPAPAANARTASMSTSTAATISTSPASASVRSAGRWLERAMPPVPTTAVRSGVVERCEDMRTLS